MTSQDAQQHLGLKSILSNWMARLPGAATSDCGKAKRAAQHPEPPA